MEDEKSGLGLWGYKSWTALFVFLPRAFKCVNLTFSSFSSIIFSRLSMHVALVGLFVLFGYDLIFYVTLSWMGSSVMHILDNLTCGLYSQKHFSWYQSTTVNLYKHVFREKLMSKENFCGRWKQILKKNVNIWTGSCTGSTGPVAAYTVIVF